MRENVTKNFDIEFEQARTFIDRQKKFNDIEIETFIGMNNEEILKYIDVRVQKYLSSSIFEFDENYDECINALKFLHKTITRKELWIDLNGNIFIHFDLDEDQDRELMVLLSKTRLPEIYTLSVNNFYESDEDLENFLENSISSVCYFQLYSGSFWIDFHDYWDKITKLTLIKHIHLKGFMIDSQDNEQIFGSWRINQITFELWNVGIEEDFCIKYKEYHKDRFWFPILSKIEFIDDETDEQSMEYLLAALSQSKLDNSLKQISLLNWLLSKDEVKRIADSVNLDVEVV